jgi:hypothetical protein
MQGLSNRLSAYSLSQENADPSSGATPAADDAKDDETST